MDILQEIDEAAEVLSGVKGGVDGVPDGEVDNRKEVLPPTLRPDGTTLPAGPSSGVWGGTGYPYQGGWTTGGYPGYPGGYHNGWWVGQGAYPNGGGWDGTAWQGVWGSGYPMRGGGWSGLENYWARSGYANPPGAYGQQPRYGDVFGNRGYGAYTNFVV